MEYEQFLKGLKVIFPQAIMLERLGLRPFSPFAWKQDIGELRHEVLHEKEAGKSFLLAEWTSDGLRSVVRAPRRI
jgi:hypothetical protein